MAVCQLTWRDYNKLLAEKKWPDCKHHRHCSRLRAMEHLQNDEAIDVPHRSAIVMHEWWVRDYNWSTVQPGLKKGMIGCIGPVGMVGKQFRAP